MRVLFLSDVYFPRVNGVSTSIAAFRADLASCGVETTLVCPHYPSGAPIAEAAVLRVASSGVPRDPEDRRMRWGPLEQTLSAFDRNQFDLVHVQTPFIAHYAGTRYARRTGIPCIATYHTFFEEYLHHYVPVLPRPAGRFLARAFTRSQCARLDALIAPSAPMEEMLRTYRVAAPIQVIPTGLPPDRFEPGNGPRFRERLGVPLSTPLLAYVGRIAHEKNIDFVARAFARVRQAMPDAVLLIAGEGPALESVQRLVADLGVADGTRFVGYLDRNTELLDCYAAANVFVFASRTETQGLVLLEAMAQGTPVVSTAALGTRSILQPHCGAVVVDEDLDAFASAVVDVLSNPALADRLATQARDYSRRWSSLGMARRLADLYRDIAGNGAGLACPLN